MAFARILRDAFRLIPPPQFSRPNNESPPAQIAGRQYRRVVTPPPVDDFVAEKNRPVARTRRYARHPVVWCTCIYREYSGTTRDFFELRFRRI